jgi:hypothetical protein
MDGEKSRLEACLLTLLEKQNRQQSDSMGSFLNNLHPLIKLATPFLAAFLWFQANFATTQMYQEQDLKITETNMRLDKQYAEVKQLIDQRHQESVTHSNENRDRMIAVMAEIKDSLKTLYLDRQVKH